MEGEARRRLSRNRKPLCDRTNTISQSQSSQSSSATVIASKTKPKPKIEPKPSAGSGNYASNPSTSLLPFRSSSLGRGDENCDVLEVGTASNCRQTVLKRVKEKTVIAPSIGYSAKRLVNVGRDRKEHKDLSSLEPCTIPRKKKQRCTKPKQDASLQEYIQQQKAYFKEIDAFELSEEEVA